MGLRGCNIYPGLAEQLILSGVFLKYSCDGVDEKMVADHLCIR